jgi:RNA exonuclease 1
MLQHLGRHIQVVNQGKIEGHDSKEDARAAGELVMWRLAGRWDRMRGEGWSVKDGVFTSPDGRTGLELGLSVEYLEAGESGPGKVAGCKRGSEEISGDM